MFYSTETLHNVTNDLVFHYEFEIIKVKLLNQLRVLEHASEDNCTT